MKANPKTNINSSDKATAEWLNSQKKGTRPSYQTLWGYFLEFTELTGDQILDSRKADKTYSWEKRVMEFKDWLINKHQAESWASTATSVVRGFFAYYRLKLEFRRTESAKLTEAQPKYEDYRFSREDLKRMFDVADLTEKYTIIAGKSFGFRAGDFIRLSRGHLEPYIDRPVPIFIGEFTTTKEKIPAYPFIDIDALPVIKLIIEKMDREERKDPNQRILQYSHEIQLSRILQRVTEKAGIKYGNKRIRFHCMRKFLIDRLSSHMSESKWKQIVGKKISEGAYVSPDSLREDYIRAMADTCFSTQPEGDVAKTVRIEIARNALKNMGFTEEEIATIGGGTGGKRFLTKDDLIKALESKIDEKRHRTAHNDGDCENGINCERFEQIKETDLLNYLRQGYQIVHKLANGELILKK